MHRERLLTTGKRYNLLDFPKDVAGNTKENGTKVAEKGKLVAFGVSRIRWWARGAHPKVNLGQS